MNKYTCLYNPITMPRAGCDIMSIFKWSLTSLNTVFIILE